jgi:hypothetical protein
MVLWYQRSGAGCCIYLQYSKHILDNLEDEDSLFQAMIPHTIIYGATNQMTAIFISTSL